MSSSKLAATFAHALRSARAARGMTQADVAERVGIAVEAYGRLERGGVLPRASTLVVLSRQLGVSTDQLLGLMTAEATKGAKRMGEAPGSYSVSNPELLRLVHKLERVPVRHLRLLTQLANALRGVAES
jgi:transcriptional regulator with XRE-family HTH domain